MTQNRNEDALEVFKKIYNMNNGLSKYNYTVSVYYDYNIDHVT